MSISSLPYSIPSSLEREKQLLITKCNLLIEAFSGLVKEENTRIQEEKKQLIANRVFIYSIKTIEDGWRVLHKETDTIIEGHDNVAWSYPFKIINGVLLYSKNAYNGKAWSSAEKLIPQGLFDEATLETINTGW